MSYEDVWDLMDEAEDLEFFEQIPLLERAVALADELDEELAWTARMELLCACAFGGAPEKTLMNFAWLESKSKQNPERFPPSHFNGRELNETDLLWTIKWVFVSISGFPQISREQIESTLERMRVMYEQHSMSLRPYWMCKVRTQIDLGDDVEGIARDLENYRTSKRDAYADCKACETHFIVETAVFLGDIDRALAAAEPILNGSQSCAEIPHLTYTTLLVPTFLAGMEDLARDFHQRGYDLCKSNPDFLKSIGEIMDFRILDGNWDGARRLFEEHVSWADETRSVQRRLRFLQSAWGLANSAPDGATIQTKSPLGPGQLSMEAWKQKLELEIDQNSAAFDRRNGNTSFSQGIAQHRRLFL